MTGHSLQSLLQSYLDEDGRSIGALASQTGIGLPTLRAVLDEDRLPRKSDHREAIRLAMGMEEPAFAEALLASSNINHGGDPKNPTLQYLVARAMFQQGLTEQGLAKLSKLPYPTVLGLVRKGSLPRQDTLNRLGDILHLDTEAVASAVERSKKRRDPNDRQEFSMTATAEGLAQIVARRIRELGLSIAGYAKQLGVGYMPISRFLSSGTPPENAAMRSAIQQDLGLSDEDFDEAMQSGSDAPKPGTVTVRAGEPPPDASPLQIALVNYMQANKLTIKGLSQRIGLSQITVSRLVKQGAQPSRTRTHQRLQSILGLGDEEYQDLVSADGGASRSAASIALQQKDGPIDDYTPSIEEPASRRARGDDDDYPTTDDLSISDVELMRLVKRLNRQQRATLATFLRTLLGS